MVQVRRSPPVWDSPPDLQTWHPLINLLGTIVRFEVIDESGTTSTVWTGPDTFAFRATPQAGVNLPSRCE